MAKPTDACTHTKHVERHIERLGQSQSRMDKVCQMTTTLEMVEQRKFSQVVHIPADQQGEYS
jgi:hypothetical protein